MKMLFKILHSLHHDIKYTPYAVYEEFSYGFFGVICLAVALLVHINNNPKWYNDGVDYIIETLDNLWISLGFIKEDTYLPLYTPLKYNTPKNKHIIINIPSLTSVKEININTVEDV